jgi:hypothetical protein
MDPTRPQALRGTRQGFGAGRNGHPTFGKGARTSRRFGFRVGGVPGGVEGTRFCSSEQGRGFREKDIVRIRRDAWQARKVPGLVQPWCGLQAHGFRGSAGNTGGWPPISSERGGEVRNPAAGHHQTPGGATAHQHRRFGPSGRTVVRNRKNPVRLPSGRKMGRMRARANGRKFDSRGGDGAFDLRLGCDQG